MACARQCDICGSFYRSNVKQVIKGNPPVAHVEFHCEYNSNRLKNMTFAIIARKKFITL